LYILRAHPTYWTHFDGVTSNEMKVLKKC